MTKTGFDFSNFDTPFDASTIAALKTDGLSFAIVGCQKPDIADGQIAALQAASVPVIGTYAFLYWGLDTTGQTQAAIDAALKYHIPYVWLDCEAEVPNEAAGQTPRTRTDQLRACVQMVQKAGLKPGIYTGAYYWPSAMGNTTEWSHLPLWHASYYDARNYEPTVSYGGWTDVAIHQYADQPAIAGRDRDYDVMFDWFANQFGIQPQEGDMDIMQLARCIARGATDPQTKQPVDTTDDAAVTRTIAALDMGGLGLANAVQSAQMAAAMASKAESDLNEAIVKRADLVRLASGTDADGYANMLKLWDSAHAEGLV